MEVWKDIEGYEGLYQVSNIGRVKSLQRIAPRSKFGNIPVKERILKFGKNRCGYNYVNLKLFSVSKTFTVHRLVTKAFLPNMENKPDVNHKNGIKTDNRVKNLEWVTTSENVKHSFKNGFQSNKCEKNPSSKISKNDVLRIRSEEFKDIPKSEIALIFGISKGNVNKILRKAIWQDI
jgi:hypothetical protein